jgi:secreted trypsin-like serine protease
MKRVKYIGLLLSFVFVQSSLAIIGGEQADPTLSKQTVILKLSNGENCSGVIVAANLILTAGHCLEGVKDKASTVEISAKGNGSKATSVKVLRRAKHPKYVETKNGKKKVNDIQYDFAFLQTEDSLLETFQLSVSDLPKIVDSREATLQELGVASSLTAYGYGTSRKGHGTQDDEAGQRKQLSMSASYNSKYNFIKTVSKEARKGLCQGDSGGGLFSVKASGLTLMGIVSGISEGSGCGSAESFAAYTLVSDHLCWIQSQTGIKLSPSQVCN